MADVVRLEAQGVTVRFEGVTALEEVDLAIESGDILGLIGPNGAGKTTLLNVISGFVAEEAGKVLLDSVDVTGWTAEARARAGLGRSFQAVRLFESLTVLENLETGALCRGGKRRREAADAARALLERVDLDHVAGREARTLPAGDRRLIGVLRALATEPDFLLLDEPAAGLNESESDELVGAIRRIRDDFGCAVLIVDHDMRVIMPLCERIQVLNFGRTIALGNPDEIRADPAVVEAYLGTTDE